MSAIEATRDPRDNAVDAFDWSPPTSGRVVAGSGALARLPALLSDLGVRHAILVTSPSMARSPVFALVREQVGERLVGVHPTVAQHAPMPDVRALKDLADSRGADGYIAVGGSSVLDAMKAAVWLDLTTAKRQAVAIPAMFGGAEVTPQAGVTEDGEKVSLADERIMPDAVVLDPRVPAALPSGLALGSVANALAHCVEGLVAADRSPMSDAFYLRALALIHTGVGQLAEQRVAALGAFQVASVLAALPRVRMAAAHAIVHALSPLLGVPHAIAHGVLCRTVMSFTAPAVPEQHELIAATLSRAEPSPAAALTQVTALLDRLGIPRGLHATGVRREQLSLVADALVTSSGPPANPRPEAETSCCAFSSTPGLVTFREAGSRTGQADAEASNPPKGFSTWPYGVVSMRTSPATRWGASRAAGSATKPPWLWPPMTARSMSSAPRSAMRRPNRKKCMIVNDHIIRSLTNLL